MKNSLLVITLLALTASLLSAQGTTPQDDPPAQQDLAAIPQEGLFSRWLQLNTLSFSMRYRNTSDFNGAPLFRFGQQRSLIDGAVKLDAEGKYAIHFHVSSGSYFNWAYVSEIGGSYGDLAGASVARFKPNQLALLGRAVVADPAFEQYLVSHVSSDRGWQMYFRQLYLSASPAKHLTFEYGGLAIEHGVSTEMTTYDDDGYIAGGRIRIQDPEHLFFDQFAVTVAYLGKYDLFDPSIFQRGSDFLHTDYQQYLAEKKVGKRLDASIDFTQHVGTHTMREALLVNAHEALIVDSLRGEFYQRLNTVSLQSLPFAGGAGFGVTATKKVIPKFKLEVGFASVDKNYPVYAGSAFSVAVGHSINGDAYAIGNRTFYRASYKPVSAVTLFGYYTHILDTNFMTLNRQSVQGGAELDLKELLNQKWHLF